MVWDHYECDGQMNIYDYLEKPKEPGPICQLANECEAYGFGCGGTIWPCRFGGPFKWSKEVQNE